MPRATLHLCGGSLCLGVVTCEVDMVRSKKKRTLIIVIIVLAVLLVAIGTIAIINGMKGKEKDPFVQKEQSTSSTSDKNNSNNSPTPTNNDTSKNTDTSKDSDAAALDPSTLATITIDPMNITVSYIKGAGGFSYEVNRTADGRRYVDFSSDALVGTKCTDDTGIFVSILQSPNENEKATVSKTTVVDGTTYGLSIASNTCTSDSAALKKYQDAFSQAFSLLKKAS